MQYLGGTVGKRLVRWNLYRYTWLSYHQTRLTPNTTYYYAAFADVEGKCGFGEVKSFTTEEDGFVPFGAVDLGLSVMWATCNLGANSPEEYGDYYAWGETEEKSDYSWDTYKWCKGTLDTMTKY